MVEIAFVLGSLKGKAAGYRRPASATVVEKSPDRGSDVNIYAAEG